MTISCIIKLSVAKQKEKLFIRESFSCWIPTKSAQNIGTAIRLSSGPFNLYSKVSSMNILYLFVGLPLWVPEIHKLTGTKGLNELIAIVI